MIRTARPQDASQIATVHVASWRSVYTGLIPDEILQNLSEEGRAKKWETIIEAHPLETIVCEQDDRIIGFANYGDDRDHRNSVNGEIRAIYLLEDYWRRRIGTQLFTTAIEDLIDLGYRSAFIWVLDNNNNAIAFYKNHGLSLDEQTKTDVIDGFELTEVRMSKSF